METWQLELLSDAPVGHLATVDAEARPHVVPVCFVWLDGVAYTPIDEKPKRGIELRRVRNLRANPSACLVVDRYAEDWSRLAWVQVRGHADVVDDSEQHGTAIAALRTKYRQYAAMRLEERPLIRLTPERVVGWRVSA